MTDRRPRLLGWLVLASVAHGLLWLSLVPPWQAPDEPKHFEYVRRLAESGRWIAFATEAEAADPALQADIVRSMDAHYFWWYGHAPGYDPARPSQRFADLWLQGSHTAFYRSSPAYYWLAARLQPADRLAGLYVARLFGVLCGAAVVFLVGWAARELAPGDPLVRYGAPAFAALHPMVAFLSAGVNNDVLVNTAAAFAFLLVVRLLVRGAGTARLVLLAAAVIAAVAIKRTAVFLVPTALAAGIAWLALRGRRWAAAAAVLLALLGTGGAAAWVWGPGTVAAALPEAWRWNLQRYFFNEPDQLDRVLAHLRAPEIGPILVEYQWRLHNGFWGSFGWQLVDLPAWMYAALGLVSLAAAAGVARRLVDPATPGPTRAVLLTSALATGLAAAGATAFFVAYLHLPYPPPPQGRYLFAALGPIAVLFTAGLGAWVPAARRPAALRALVAAMVAFDAIALLGFVVPYFYR